MRVRPRRISEKLGGVPVLSSDDYKMYELVSILRACHMMVSSRYHGIVTSMPGAGAVGGNHHGRAHPQPDARART